jgi:dihydroorotate dehydrogenase
MIDPYRLFSPLVMRLDPETAHELARRALRTGLLRWVYHRPAPDAVLATSIWQRPFASPIGVAAGFDKNAEVADALLDLGFGFAEVGGVTPRPQAGNPRPRLFRLTEDRAVINRMGFNNDGAEVVAGRLSLLTRRRGPIGVNLGINKESTDAPADFATVARLTAAYADFLVVNVSSPNTPGLRALQNTGPLRAIITAVREARDRVASAAPPILLKLAPDLADEDVSAIADLARAENIDGLVISNTTISRPDRMTSPHLHETGGLSGQPLFARSTAMLSRVYSLTQGAIPLIGVGGVGSGADAYAKIRAGASLVQLYSALVFEGPALIGRITSDLAALLKRDGFAKVADAVGADHRKSGTAS